METSRRERGRPSATTAAATSLWAIVAALVATSVSAVDCPADAGLHGTVRSLSGKPVADAAVTLTTSARTVATGEDGRFCLFQVEPGVHRLVVFADRYGVAEQELLVGDQGATQVDVRLRAAFGEEVVISATRTGKRLADVPLHVQTVRRSQIEGVVARTLADAVEWTRGVRVESNCQSCNTSQIRLLGLEGPYSQVLVDGQPTVSSLAMVYGIEQLPARLIDSIEVVRGGGSPAYGAGAVAGVINLIPHHPHCSMVRRMRHLPWWAMASRYSSQSGCSPEMTRKYSTRPSRASGMSRTSAVPSSWIHSPPNSSDITTIEAAELRLAFIDLARSG